MNPKEVQIESFYEFYITAFVFGILYVKPKKLSVGYNHKSYAFTFMSASVWVGLL